MKITMIELSHVSIPLAKPYRLSKVYGTVREAQAVIALVHTDQGIIGFGEADPLPPFTDESAGGVMAVIRDCLGPALLNEDPTRISFLWKKMEGAIHGNPMAKGALDTALYDILGKQLDVPVYTLLGGSFRSRIEVLWPLGSGSPQEDTEQIEEKLNEGYRTFMLKMGALPIPEEVERIRAVRERFGSEIHLMVDVNQGWRVEEALEFASALGGYRLDFIEQPVARRDLKGLGRIRERSGFAVSADESLVTPSDAVELIEQEAVDIFSVKVSKNGGISQARKIALLAEVSGIRCLVNSMLEFGISQAAALHLGAAMPNLLDCGHCYMSTLRMADDITDFSAHVKDATAVPPDSPGLGVHVDSEKVEKYRRGYLKIS
ncbi:MAG: mandelate racemase [Deltaproteobacteria bacterium]|nr:mandelate racemase [Deltaproteobacteria bacterium]